MQAAKERRRSFARRLSRANSTSSEMSTSTRSAAPNRPFSTHYQSSHAHGVIVARATSPATRATFAAIRRASSLVSGLAADLRPGDIRERPLLERAFNWLDSCISHDPILAKHPGRGGSTWCHRARNCDRSSSLVMVAYIGGIDLVDYCRAKLDKPRRREAARLQCGRHAQPLRFVDAIGCSMVVWRCSFASKTVTCGPGYLFFISCAAFSAASYVPNPDLSCRSTAT